MPPYSPSFAEWMLIGAAYYAMCFIVLRHLLVASSRTWTQLLTLAMLIFVLLANAFWNDLFFRRRELRASFIALVPYTVLVAGLVVLLAHSYLFGAVLFMCYGVYLLYATWWGYRLWLLNRNET
jgi:tryptophan-rich sensory protein